MNTSRCSRAALAIFSILIPLSLGTTTALADALPGPAICSFDVRDTATPGWMMTPSAGTAHATGTMTCLGSVGGNQLTGGAGPFEWWYSYGSSDVPFGGNTCALFGGTGTWKVSLPMAEGSPLILTGSWAWTGILAAGEVHGHLGGHPVKMVWQAYLENPDEDCVTKPAAHFRTIAQGTLG